MKALITGIAGFAGSHLADFLLGRGNLEVSGIEITKGNFENIKHIKRRIKIYQCDICNIDSVKRVIKHFKPDLIFHLAAQAFIPDSWIMPSVSLHTNIIGTVNILETVRILRLNTRIQVACSAEEYGKVYRNEVPVRESNPFRPQSPYAVGKIGQDMLGFQYYQSYGMFIVRTRAFNHAGPRMRESFVTSSFARQIALIEKGRQKPVIYVGDLGVIRDFTDVRDVVRAYWLSLRRCKPGEVYNICSAKCYKIKDILGILLGFTKKNIKILRDRARMRLSDAMVLVGDNSKFCRQTGWRPKIQIEDTLRDILNYWRAKV